MNMPAHAHTHAHMHTSHIYEKVPITSPAVITWVKEFPRFLFTLCLFSFPPNFHSEHVFFHTSEKR